ncbi:hypothetical protein QF117_20165 [Vibrio sp. YMD68]|uniref:hypothetical protein n=1 Tax=Vibrio sp. YMD68 TaxID=3042300 RepID=UPI00249CE722|nr:hypothetical protein [Vibrio sp. YMD68]WGW00168.1 hypothetical protein QF117_20165 [Vibrio sp. YMD68]
MNNSLLVNVSKYASSDKTSPTENFITEAFAWLLRNDAEVRRAIDKYLRKVGEEKSLNILPVGDSRHIDTQVNFNGTFPDMCWDSSDRTFSIIFEHKVWTKLSDKQLDNYRKYAEEKLGKAFVIVLITGHVGQHKQNPDLALCWYQIAEIIESVEGGNDKDLWIREEFIHLLKVNRLVDITPINPLSIAYYNDAKKIDEQLNNIAKRAIHKKWPIQQLEGDVSYNKEVYQRKVGVSERCGKYDTWGRIGLEFNNVTQEYDEGGWAPGLFCGFLIDSADHCVEDIMPNEPLAALIVDIDDPLHSKLNSRGLYEKLVNEICLPNGWKLSDRVTQNNNENPWHPLIIYRSLSDFIGHASTPEQQSETFFTQMKELQKALINTNSFVAFCKEMHHIYEESL